MSVRHRRWNPLLAAVAGAAAAVWTAPPPATADGFDDDHRLASSLVTPHTAWGRGWAHGRARVLFLVGRPRGEGESGPGTAGRDVIELLQRFDLDADIVYMHADGVFRSDPQQFPQQEGPQRLARLLEQPWDAFVSCNARLEKLPPDALAAIRERIQAGAGLVHFGPKPPAIVEDGRAVPTPEALTAGLPLDLLPSAPPRGGGKPKRDPKPPALSLTVREAGRGRTLAVAFPGEPLAVTPAMEFDDTAAARYEYAQAFAGRLILWAAGRGPRLDVSGFDLASPDAPPAVERAALPGAKLRVRVFSPGLAPAPWTAQCSLRRPDGWTRPAATVEERNGERADGHATFDVPLPDVPAGAYLLDVLISSPRGREGFGALPFEVTSAAGVDALALDAPFVEPGGAVAGRVTLRGGGFDAAHRLRVSLRDAHGRATARAELPLAADAREVPFSLPLPAATTIGMRAEAALIAGGRELEVRSAAFTVPDRRRGRFNFVLWGGWGDAPGVHAMRVARDTGFTVFLGGGAPGAAAAAADLAHVPYTTHLNGDPGSGGVCWNDAPAIDGWVQGIVDGAGPRAWAKPPLSRAHGAFVYSLGDEVAVAGACGHPACLGAFRADLRAGYGAIDALNASWETSFASFDEVVPQSDEAALKTGRYPRWHDRVAFAKRNFPRLCRRFAEAFRKLDPQAVSGFEGAGSFGDDVEGFVRDNGFWVPYPGRGVDDMIRSLAPREFVRSNWTGYERNARGLAAGAWRSITLGADSLWWFEGGSWLTPGFDLRPAAAEFHREMRVVREGLGDLLVRSEMPFDGVAVLYSLPSALSCEIPESSSTLGDRTEMNNPGRPHWAVGDITKDLGFQFRYVTSRLLEDGALERDGVRALWLPLAQALGPGEAAAVRRFVEAGGWAIADLRPGMYDAHCKPLAAGLLDDVFGARREGRGPGREAALALRVRFAGREISLENKSTQIDPHLRAAGAEALASHEGVPLVLVRRAGKGAAVLLNFELSRYSEFRHEPEADGMRELVGAIYAAAGLKPRVRVEGVAAPARAVEVAHWRCGNAFLFSLFRNTGMFHSLGPVGLGPKTPLDVRAALDAPAHVYDLRRRKYLGLTAQIDARLESGLANFYAALPEPVGDVALAPAKPVVRGGETLEARVSCGLAATPAAYAIEATAPSGAPAPWLWRVVVADRGEARFAVPVAFNDAGGRWILRATELYTGRTAEAAYRVEAAEPP